eukprot:TRINITY_DN11062_c0_g1_i1.p1 TRINITY_DN11062_c0_g1~~TRINITY_DN11062_c0_g1_i1.p1  ORF type:complete len:661 (-),score=97.70 TRINITY_DN11062_c0_g1_i1:94-1896(-)
MSEVSSDPNKGLLAKEERMLAKEEGLLAQRLAEGVRREEPGKSKGPEEPKEYSAGGWAKLDVMLTRQNLQSMLAAFANFVSLITGGNSVIQPDSYDKETLDGMEKTAFDHVNKVAQLKWETSELIALHVQTVQGVNFGLTLRLRGKEAPTACWFARYTGLLLGKKDGFTWKITGACHLSACHEGLPLEGKDKDCFVELDLEEPYADDLVEDPSVDDGMPKGYDDKEVLSQIEEQYLELLETKTTLLARTETREDRLLQGCPLTLEAFCNGPMHTALDSMDRCLPKRYLFWDEYPACKLPIRQQWTCGSCWAFANTRMIGERLCRATQGRVKIWPSVLQVINCCKQSHPESPCNGGEVITDNCLKQKGLVAESHWSYDRWNWWRFSRRNCKFDAPNWKYESVILATELQGFGGTKNLKREVFCHGPAFVVADTGEPFVWYEQGRPADGHSKKLGEGGHAITLEGWDGNKFFIANSWGGWGNPNGEAVLVPSVLLTRAQSIHPRTDVGGFLKYGIIAVKVEGRIVGVIWKAPADKHSRKDTVGLYRKDSYVPVATAKLGAYGGTGAVELEIPENSNDEYVLRIGLKGTKDIVYTHPKTVRAQ